MKTSKFSSAAIFSAVLFGSGCNSGQYEYLDRDTMVQRKFKARIVESLVKDRLNSELRIEEKGKKYRFFVPVSFEAAQKMDSLSCWTKDEKWFCTQKMPYLLNSEGDSVYKDRDDEFIIWKKESEQIGMKFWIKKSA